MCGGDFKLGSVRRAIQVLPIAFFMLNATALAIFNVLPRRGGPVPSLGRGRGWCGGARQFPTKWRPPTPGSIL